MKTSIGKNTSGATIVEFAVVLPLFFMLTIGIFAWGLALWQINALQYAAERSARCDILPRPTSGTKACGDLNDIGNLSIGWIPGLTTNSFNNSLRVTRSLPAVNNVVVDYDVSCVYVQTDNNYIPGYSWLPNFLKQSYCRPRQ